MKKQIKRCPNCGEDVTDEAESGEEMACPVCCWSFWPSECLPDDYQKEGFDTLKNLRGDK
jgi:hypothetical protein